MSKKCSRFIALLLAFLLVMPVMNVNANEKITITSFADQAMEELLIREKVLIEEILDRLPTHISAYDSAKELVEIPVTWECMGDYATTDFYYYQFVPKWDDTVYAVEESLSVPYIWVELEANGSREVTTSENEMKIFNYLVETMGCNKATALGIVANIERESNFNPVASVIDTNGLTSYGICQWNGSRFEGLKSYCTEKELDYTTVEGQLDYLKYELGSSERSAWNRMQGIPNTAEGAYTAGYTWARYFERCAAVYHEVSAIRARDVYWPEYCDVAVPENHNITFDLQGTTIATSVGSSTVNGFNIARGSDKLIIYNIIDSTPGTNSYGVEVLVDANGLVTQKRATGSTTQFTVPAGGFVLSGHGTAADFINKIKVGNYAGYTTGEDGTATVHYYNAQNEYLFYHKKVKDGMTYGTLPVVEKEGYILGGWYTELTGGERVTEETQYISANLYARWIDENASQNPFTDVPENEYYYEPVLWAVNQGITSGLKPGLFAPEESCTRGQVVTFLWRAKGCPEPTTTTHNFTDLKENEYYYKAVLWAVENGITAGLKPTLFAPDATVTRGQVVTFLHRAEGTPSYSVDNSFTDLKTGEYYYDAVLWAVENGVTSGLKPTLFGPEEPCTRGQVVTFLYRAYNK